MLTINVAVLLAVVIVLLLRRPVQPRTRMDQALTMLAVLAFGVLVAPTEFGQGVLNAVGQLVQGVSQVGGP